MTAKTLSHHHLHLYSGSGLDAWSEALDTLREVKISASAPMATIDIGAVVVFVRSSAQPEQLQGFSPRTFSVADGCVLSKEVTWRLILARLVPLAELRLLALRFQRGDPSLEAPDHTLAHRPADTGLAPTAEDLEGL